MNVLVVYESSFGTTAAVARAIASGARGAGAEVDIAHAASAPGLTGVDLVVVGAPTHNLGLPSATSRERAVQRGATVGNGGLGRGVADWLGTLPRLGMRAAVFDTVLASRFSGSAAKRIERRLSRLGGSVIDRAEFTVAGSPPVLAAGELERAEAWGAALVGR